MKTPGISIIVPVYQTEKYVGECIDSILGQSFTDFELLLIDDGSTDGSGLICDRYAQMDARVRVIHKKNAGVSAARNTGLGSCLGEYIVFVDSDDSVDRIFLERAVKSLVDTQADMFLSGFCMETWKEGGVIKREQFNATATQCYRIKELLENMNHTYPVNCLYGLHGKLYKRKIIQENNIRFTEQLNYGEDRNFNCDYFLHCGHVVFSQEIFYHYRCGNVESLAGRFHRDSYEILKMIYSQMRMLMQYCGCSSPAIARFEAMYFRRQLGGIHEFYRFYEKTTAKERYTQIVKVAGDPCISEVQMRCLSSWKNRILLALLRMKLHWAVALIFEIRYCWIRNRCIR